MRANTKRAGGRGAGGRVSYESASPMFPNGTPGGKREAPAPPQPLEEGWGAGRRRAGVLGVGLSYVPKRHSGRKEGGTCSSPAASPNRTLDCAHSHISHYSTRLHLALRLIHFMRKCRPSRREKKCLEKKGKYDLTSKMVIFFTTLLFLAFGIITSI